MASQARLAAHSALPEFTFARADRPYADGDPVSDNPARAKGAFLLQKRPDRRGVGPIMGSYVNFIW